jgi:FtsZ-interacting cell division protein ZipA
MFYNCFAQIIPLGQGSDIESWMDILVLVVVAVIYGLGALIKATRSRKSQEQKATAREQQSGRAQRKPSKGGKGLFDEFITEIKKAAEQARTGTETRPTGQTPTQKKAQSRAVLQKYAAKTKQQHTAQPKRPPAQPAVSKAEGQVRYDFDKLGDMNKAIRVAPDISTRFSGLSGKPKPPADEAEESMHLSQVLADYEDPEQLRTAILHYEILGKPLALRDPSPDIMRP